jgi:hypothetical protein
MRKVSGGGTPTLTKETFRELMRDLTTLFTHFSSELEKLIRIDEILQTLSDSFTG